MPSFIVRVLHRLLSLRKARLRFRAAEATDVDAIVEVIVAESAHGYFNSDYLIPGAAHGLRQQVTCLVNDLPVPMPGERNGSEGRALVIQVNGHDVGFALLLSDRPHSWSTRVEVFALVILPSHRHIGVGTQAVRQLVAGVQSASVYARCYRESKTMRNIFERCGFAVIDESPRGTVTLELRLS